MHKLSALSALKSRTNPRSELRLKWRSEEARAEPESAKVEIDSGAEIEIANRTWIKTTMEGDIARCNRQRNTFYARAGETPCES
ncbi:hypothetical protein EVAR_26674_1 [Eumeta japonica]|uniref:Uncharacterized protein n=1 Tax=Eumeta variegata TaxID=151549 RepID=A0A4C1VMF6_EUMVA|nr:hypothetical protein EVAR_26674_1 [Eumeta japonica]